MSSTSSSFWYQNPDALLLELRRSQVGELLKSADELRRMGRLRAALKTLDAALDRGTRLLGTDDSVTQHTAQALRDLLVAMHPHDGASRTPPRDAATRGAG